MGRVWRKAVDGATPWARDNIAWSCVMAASPAVGFAMLYREGHTDLRLVWLTFGMYGLALIFYCAYRLIRAIFGVRREDEEYAQRLMAHATAQSALLCTFEAGATELLIRLEELWQHWNNAGEVLLYPLGDNPLKNLDHYNSIDLELRDFKLLYGTHIQRVALDIPKFRSAAVIGGYRSNREYAVVLRDLKEHAQGLGDIAKDLYETEVPL